MILYGIPTCDTCRKALRALRDAGRDVAFRDIRAEPLTADELATIIARFGQQAVNRQSATFRGFDAALREADPQAQISARPTVMRRPIIRDGDQWYLGWNAANEDALTRRDRQARA